MSTHRTLGHTVRLAAAATSLPSRSLALTVAAGPVAAIRSAQNGRIFYSTARAAARP